MDPQRLKLHIGMALRHRDIRKTVAAFSRLHSAVSILDHLPAAGLEALRDFCQQECKACATDDRAFNTAYLTLVEQVLRNKLRDDRRLLHGITGEPQP